MVSFTMLNNVVLHVLCIFISGIMFFFCYFLILFWFCQGSMNLSLPNNSENSMNSVNNNVRPGNKQKTVQRA